MHEPPHLPPRLDALRAHVLEHSVKRGDFVLKSGRPSSWFLDTKQTACRPDGILLVADAMLDVIPDDATAIGGLTMGADPVAFDVWNGLWEGMAAMEDRRLVVEQRFDLGDPATTWRIVDR